MHAILAAAGIVDGGDGEPTFNRGDGSEARVASQAQIYEDVRLTPEDPVVLQVSRWDHLKDPEGVIRGFAEHASAHETGAHLIYAGPAVEAVSDDPEGAQVLQEAIELRESLSDEARRNVHLVCLPMDDAEENAVIVNALQRNASVVVQKSIAEGFGLTVAEAMWKGAADRRHRGRRHPGPGRRRRDAACCWPTRATSTPTARRCAGCSRTPSGRSGWGRRPSSACATSSSARAA